MSNEVSIRFELEKETKNAVRYKEVPEEGRPEIVGTLYVKKFHAGGAKSLTVTITKND